MKLRLGSTCIIAVLSAGTALGDVTSWKTVGDWDISFYPNGPGCLAYTVYEEGTSFFIGFFRGEAQTILDVTLMDDRWQSIEAGKEYEIRAYFGDETPWTLQMSGKDYGGTPGLNFGFEASSDQAGLFVEEFQRELNMEWFYQGVSLGNFTLRGSRAALEEAARCQVSFNEAMSNASDPFGVGSSNSTDPFAR